VSALPWISGIVVRRERLPLLTPAILVNRKEKSGQPLTNDLNLARNCRPFKHAINTMISAIRVDNLGKCYRVAHNQQRMRYRTFRDSIADAVKSSFRRMMNGGESDTAEDFWALEDVSFEVQPGEVVGIIGRNGAGKSTLLKILSRIAKPTKGRVELNGRIGSLLEVGTGFHPVLTGRENVYLNGSILGMSKLEIDRRFDEIVAFAEIEKFRCHKRHRVHARTWNTYDSGDLWEPPYG